MGFDNRAGIDLAWSFEIDNKARIFVAGCSNDCLQASAGLIGGLMLNNLKLILRIRAVLLVVGFFSLDLVIARLRGIVLTLVVVGLVLTGLMS